MRSLLLVAVLALPHLAHADDSTLFCVFPEAKPLPECFKGSSLGEDDVERCEARQKLRKKVPPRIRIDGGAWVTFSPTTWRCVAVPVGKSFRYSVENHGAVFASEKMTIPATPACATGRVDLTRPNFYGSMWAKCSRRKNTTRDEVVTP